MMDSTIEQLRRRFVQRTGWDPDTLVIHPEDLNELLPNHGAYGPLYYYYIGLRVIRSSDVPQGQPFVCKLI